MKNISISSRGFQLIELIVILAILGILTTLAVPFLLRITADLRVSLAATELAAILRSAKLHALRYGVKVGVKFFTDDDVVTFALYQDGDGDGVRTKDIDAGVDPQVTPARPLTYMGRHVRFGFPPGPPPRAPGNPHRRLKRLADPIRFNRSDLASFSPIGGSTPGSLYITDGQTRLAVVRVYNRSGKVTVLRYDSATGHWR